MYLAIDIGGSKTLIALFSEKGRILRQQKFPTAMKPEVFFADFRKRMRDFLPKRKIRFLVPKISNIVIAIAATVEDNQPVKYGNLPEWEGYPFNKKMEDFVARLYKEERIQGEQKPIIVLNDALLGGIYEAGQIEGPGLGMVRAGQNTIKGRNGYKNSRKSGKDGGRGGRKKKIIYLTYSTGVGGSIFTYDKEGVKNEAFEPGHKKYIFKSKRLEYEDIASASAIFKEYGVVATTITEETAFLDIALRMSVGLSEIIMKHRPDMVVIGGALGMRLKYYEKYLLKFLRASFTGKMVRIPKIVSAKRPLESTIYGCYVYGKEQNGESSKS